MRVLNWLICLLTMVALTLTAPQAAAGPYQPFEFLIGEWDISQGNAPPAMVARFKWGPNRSFIQYAASLVTPSGERPHFEGVFMWNGVSKNLDMLIMLDLTERAAVLERGTVSVDPAGVVVRTIEAQYSEGAAPMGGTKAGPSGMTVNYRQTYRKLGPDRIVTSAMRETAQGWVPTFPGSDNLTMTRRPAVP